MNKILICNLKENNTNPTFKEYIKKINENQQNVDLIVCPQAPYIYMVNGNAIKGAQDVSKYKNGAHTGEISAYTLKDVGVKYCIVGHKERNENVEDVILKITNLLDENIIPVFMVGEDEKKENQKDTLQIIEKQISEVYNQLPYDKLENIIISYEPKWMIENTIDIDIEKLDTTIKTIKSIVNSYYEVIPKVIYGGGVDANKIGSLNKITCLDGLIIASNSINIIDFENIIQTLT